MAGTHCIAYSVPALYNSPFLSIQISHDFKRVYLYNAYDFIQVVYIGMSAPSPFVKCMGILLDGML